MVIDPSLVNDILLVLGGLAALSFVALWISLLIWVWRDVRKRSRDPFFRLIAVLFVMVLFVPGALIYLLLRPSRTTEDEYQANLEEEAMLQAIEDSALCPGCNRKIREDWIICPSCHTRLRKTCHHCGVSCGTSQPWSVWR